VRLGHTDGPPPAMFIYYLMILAAQIGEGIDIVTDAFDLMVDNLHYAHFH